MAGDVRILFVEDSPIDFHLEERQLRSAGLRFTSKRVENGEDLIRELDEFKPHLVISDYSLPTIEGPAILKIVRENRPTLPFIFVSGTIGEERAVESMKNGATDYVIKDRMNSLGLKVQRALREVEEREARRLLGEQLRHSQKMEAIGRLAGGVAHDFNNLLTVINGYTEIALGALPEPHPSRPDLEEVYKAGQRGAALTRQLLIFGRKQVTQAVTLDLNEAVAAMDRMLARLVGQDIKIATVLAPVPCRVTADPTQIEQVIVNLVVNARDAMPNGGRISIETGLVEVGDDYVRTHPGLRPGPHARLTICDSGAGIPPEILDHIFEPFFTTKDVGRGTGLGLSLVHGIVSQAGGTIDVRSDVGRGSTFVILLPVSAKPETRVPPQIPAVKGAATGTETILLAEDQESVRKLTAAVLEASGYTVLKATDGTDALNRCAAHAGPIHLLLTDLVMQTMTGVELAGLVRRHHPETKFLLMSGYAYRNPQLHDLIQAGLPFLEKPFTPEDLKRKVRDVLDAT
jgi:two-component system, cell cycle sensor histidine kinase and response regulator CckA